MSLLHLFAAGNSIAQRNGGGFPSMYPLGDDGIESGATVDQIGAYPMRVLLPESLRADLSAELAADVEMRGEFAVFSTQIAA